jgi:dolichol-phosphate mannosyltransferase
MIDQNRCLVIIPTFNEVENINLICAQVRKISKADILIIDDGSTDGTIAQIRELGCVDSKIFLLLRQTKEGLGKAYQAGFSYAFSNNYNYIIHLDADGSHNAEIIPKLISLYEEGFDLVIGSRYVPGGSVSDWSLSRQLISRLGNLYAKLALGLQIKDLTSGFRLYSIDSLKKIKVENATAEGYAFQVQMTYLFRNFRCTEVPITFKDRTKGKSKMGHKIILEALIQIPLIRLK